MPDRITTALVKRTDAESQLKAATAELHETIREAQLMRLLEDRIDDPTIQEIGRQLDKAETLRSKLYAAQLRDITGHD